MKDDGSPFRNPFQWLFHASLLVLGAAIVLNLAVNYLRSILPWLIGAGGLFGLTWGAVAVIRWRRSQW